MELPSIVTGSRVWARLASRPEYVDKISEIRYVAEKLGAEVKHIIPEFTDHSVAHMDALWGVADEILSSVESDQLTAGESLLLGAAFYVHDLGMAFAATKEGATAIRATSDYASASARLKSIDKLTAQEIDVFAVRQTSRQAHAQKACDLATKPIPGIGRYLVECSGFRDRWGYMIGQVSASHHWDLDRVHRTLGARGPVPGPDSELVDLGYVACVLRLVDFAHMNRSRAGLLDRMLRSDLSPESILHWDAQAKISGPTRREDEICYSSVAPLENVDAWWLFFDMVSELDAEIRQVHEYLRGRTASAGRFSLQGVRGVASPQWFNQYVQLTSGTIPIDIRVQPNSMERVVELLGGRKLYGPDKLAPLRELIQNARDAISLRMSMEHAAGQPSLPGRIMIALDDSTGRTTLTVGDNGTGMKRDVVAKHLLGVGSDFWHSTEFYRDYEAAERFGFEPIGKFGIGFLSVFMFGHLVEVETEAVASPRVLLKLRGVGRRGILSELPSTGKIGTEIRITLKPEAVPLFGKLAKLVRARAPMLSIPITVTTSSSAQVTEETIEPNWWARASYEDFAMFVREWASLAYTGNESGPRPDRWEIYRWSLRTGSKFDLMGWPGPKPEFCSTDARVSSSGGVSREAMLRCSQGIAIGLLPHDDLIGIVDVGAASMTVSRSALDIDSGPVSYGLSLGASVDPRCAQLRSDIRDDVIAKLDDLGGYGMIPARLKFLRHLYSVYGCAVLRGSKLPWIPVLEPPGNTMHHSCAEFGKMILNQSRVVVATGIPHAGACGVAAKKVAPEELARTLVVAFRHEEIDVEYTQKQHLKAVHGDTIEGTFDEILTEIEGRGNKLELLPFLLDLIAEAWGPTAQDLMNQQWILELESDVFWSVLERNPHGGSRLGPARHH